MNKSVSTKFYIQDEMNQLLVRYNTPKLTEKKVDKLNRSMFIKETELIMKSLPRLKAPSPEGFTSKIYQTFQKKKKNYAYFL